MGLLGMIGIVSLLVAFYSITQATKNETRLLTRNMGFNVRILPGDTDMNLFWINGYSDLSISEKIVDKLMDEKAINYAHLTATLHKKIEWKGIEVILTGISGDEKEPKGGKKSKMIFAIEKGKVYLGYEIAQQFGLEVGDMLTIIDRKFEVSETLSETGSTDDIRVYFDLETLQQLVDMEGRINEVMAINCMCSTENGDPLGELRSELAKIVPEAKVIMDSTIADARENQRKMADKYFALLFPIIVLLSALWIGFVAMNNAQERSHEIGIMKAIGFSNWKISRFFLLRALTIGVFGAFIGYIIGSLLSYYLGPSIFKLTIVAVLPKLNILFGAVLLAPIFSAMASLLPVLWAVNQDTAQLLKEQ